MSQQIYELIPKVMKDIGAVAKTRKNEQQKYSFRGIEDFYQAAHPAMITHGIFCAPRVEERDIYRFEKTNEYGKVTTWIHATLRVCHRFYAPDGSSVDVVTVGEGLDNSDKASNKAMSGAMKYALIELFCVPTEDVEDVDRTTPEAGMKPKSNVARIEQDIPVPAKGEVILPPDDQLITVEQAKKLHIRFRDELSDELKPQADALLHDFLGRKLIMDSHGNPSASGIRKDEYVQLGKQAVSLAKSLSADEVTA